MLHSIPSPNQQRRPLPSLLSDSYSMVLAKPQTNRADCSSDRQGSMDPNSFFVDLEPAVFLNAEPAVFLNADPDPASFLMRIRIQIKKMKSFLKLKKQKKIAKT